MADVVRVDGVRGLDVSAWQRPDSIDWGRARALGFEFVYVRGVRKGDELDQAAAAHVRGARAAGFAVGLYGFFEPGVPVPVTDAAMRRAHDACGVGLGDLAPALDLESHDGARASRAWVAPACGLLDLWADRWGAALRYHNASDWAPMGRPAELEAWPLWLADYTPPADLPYLIWQVRAARVPELGLALDQNVAAGPLPRIGPAGPPPVVHLTPELVAAHAALALDLRRSRP